MVTVFMNFNTLNVVVTPAIGKDQGAVEREIDEATHHYPSFSHLVSLITHAQPSPSDFHKAIFN